MTIGAVLVAYGDAARRECTLAIESLRRSNGALPITVVCAEALCAPGARCVTFDDTSPGARWAKLNCNRLVPSDWQAFAYLDADTRVYGDLSPAFALLADGWELALAPSAHQGDDVMWHVSEEERWQTLLAIGNPLPLQLQAGVMFVRRCEAIQRLFECWREEWQRWRDQDQAAFLRALHRAPVRLWLLDNAWNGGAIIAHRWGAIRRA